MRDFLLVVRTQSLTHELVKDTILECMSHAPGDVMRSAVREIRADPRMGLGFKIEDCKFILSSWLSLIATQIYLFFLGKLLSTISLRTLFYNPTYRTLSNFQELSRFQDYTPFRQFLQFLSLLLAHRVEGCFYNNLLSSLLSKLVNLLSSGSLSALRVKCLLQPLVTVLSVLESSEPDAREGRIKKLWDDDTLWHLLGKGIPTSIPTACGLHIPRCIHNPHNFLAAFAPYVVFSASRGYCSASGYIEAWNFFRDALLLVLNHQYLDMEEPLALLASTDICCALVVLLGYAKTRVGAFRLLITAHSLMLEQQGSYGRRLGLSAYTHVFRNCKMKRLRINTTSSYDKGLLRMHLSCSPWFGPYLSSSLHVSFVHRLKVPSRHLFKSVRSCSFLKYQWETNTNIDASSWGPENLYFLFTRWSSWIIMDANVGGNADDYLGDSCVTMTNLLLLAASVL